MRKLRMHGAIVTIIGVLSALAANYTSYAWVGIGLVFVGALMFIFSFSFFSGREAAR